MNAELFGNHLPLPFIKPAHSDPFNVLCNEVRGTVVFKASMKLRDWDIGFICKMAKASAFIQNTLKAK